MVGELLAEISDAIGVKAFNFDLDETTARLQDFLNHDKYFVFVARCDSSKPIGFIALYESYALNAEGAFGTIAELYVRPEYRSKNVGLKLIMNTKLAFLLAAATLFPNFSQAALLNFNDGDAGDIIGSLYAGEGVNAQRASNLGLAGSSGPYGISAIGSYQWFNANPVIAYFSTDTTDVSITCIDILDEFWACGSWLFSGKAKISSIKAGALAVRQV